MDAKQLGKFIAERRKELGLTQAALAQQLHVTDKAISRWERGIGFPDMGNIEILAEALDVGLIELMQSRRNESDQISTKEAEQLLLDTIQLSKSRNPVTRAVGSIVLAAFALAVITILCVLISDWKAVIFSAGSLITGLIAWGIPVWQITFSRTSRADIAAISSFGSASVALLLQFLDIANEVHTGDMIAIEDTIDGLVIVVFAFVAVTFLLNAVMARVSKHNS